MSKCVVACSGGPDSMALLDILNQKKKEIVVAHVNYDHRDTAFRDEKIVRDYCLKNHLEFRVCYPKHEAGNFQAWARDVRYAFFEEVAKEFDCQDIYVAHQMDDVIETYIFQKNRGMICEYYGLKDVSYRHGFYFRRPLLKYTKSELEQYCKDHHVDFGIDESNLTNHYTRNQIRHSLIDHLSKSEKLVYIQKIELENVQLFQQNEYIRSFLKDWDQSVSALMDQSLNWLILDYYLYGYIRHHFSKKYMLDLLKQVRSSCLIEIEDYYLESHLGKLKIQKKKEPVYVSIPLLKYQAYQDFILCDSGSKMESMYVRKSDFPLIVRNVKAGDKIKMRFGDKSLSRFFVDRKISKVDRLHYLVVENASGDIIFVPGLGCDVNHYNNMPNLCFRLCF